MRCFSVAGAARGVPVELQIVPAGNVVPPLLLLVLALLVDVLPPPLVLDVLAPLLLLPPPLVVLDVLAPLPLVVDLLLPLEEVLSLPPDPLEEALDPFPPQAMKELATTGIDTRQAAMESDWSFMRPTL